MPRALRDRRAAARASRAAFVPIVIAGSVEGRDKAKATYDRLLGSARALYDGNVDYYRAPRRSGRWRWTRPTIASTPRFAWAKVGVDKGLATNPLLGTGLVAGFRTSGESERPGLRLDVRPRRALDRRWPSTPTATSRPRAPPSTSCASSSAPTARSPTRSRRARRSSRGSPTTSTRGTARTPRRCTSSLQADHWRYTGDRELPARDLGRRS